MEQTKKMARIIRDALEEKKGEDVRILDISEVSVLADYFIIANGTSNNQVKALVDNVEEKMAKAGYELKQSEGNGTGTWVLLDYDSVLVHVFNPQSREFYNLEKLWSEGEEIEFEILDIIENEEGKFYVLFPYYENPADAVNDPGEYYIMEVFEKDGEEELAEIEDDEKLDRIAAIFEENYYNDDEEDEE